MRPLVPFGFGIASAAGPFGFLVLPTPRSNLAASKEKAKRKCYDQLPPHLVPRTIYIMHDLTYQEVIQKVRDAGLLIHL
jgi:hypothetical protein